VPVIKASSIRKSFRKKEVLKEVSLSVEEGEIYGILGPNGAGKTTLISILSSILLPDSGSVRILGMDLRRESRKIRKVVNVCSGNPNFIWSMSAYENLAYYSMLYGLGRKERKKRIEKYSTLLELGEHLHARFDTLSSGMKQRVAIVKALLNEPKVLFLDEPTLGLDPDIAWKLRNFIRKLHEEENLTMVLTTHNMREAEYLCDRIAFLRGGEKIIEDSPSGLKSRIRIETRIDILADGALDFLKELDGILSIQKRERWTTIKIRDGFLGSLLLSLSEKIKIEDIKIYEPDLEDVFIELAK
jgi:ABC-2 type transport system ATP-binding protein